MSTQIYNRLECLFVMSKDVAKVRSARLAAAVYQRNKLISLGVNSYKTHPMAKKYQKHDKTDCLHAEVAAIKNALRNNKDLSGMSLYVARAIFDNEKTEAQWANAQPCNGCREAIKAHKIKRVYYTIGPKEYGTVEY